MRLLLHVNKEESDFKGASKLEEWQNSTVPTKAADWILASFLSTDENFGFIYVDAGTDGLNAIFCPLTVCRRIPQKLFDSSSTSTVVT